MKQKIISGPTARVLDNYPQDFSPKSGFAFDGLEGLLL